jgi:HK97 family phage portal protein
MLANFFSSAARAVTSLARPRNQISTRTITFTDPEAWSDYIGSVNSEAGVRVTHDDALGVGAVFQAVSMISADAAGMTLNVHKRLPCDEREIDHDHPAQSIVSVQANEETSSLEFWGRIIAHTLLWGNGYAQILRLGPQIVGMLNLLPDRTKPMRTREGMLFYLTEVDLDGRRVPVPMLARDVFHLKGLSFNNGCGADLVAYARNAIGLALAAEGFNSKFFAGGCAVAGILEVPPTFTDKAVHNLTEGFRAQANAQDKFKVAILRDGAKFQKLTASAEESQTHELREDQVRDIGRFFNLPPMKLGIPGSVSYNSQEQAQIQYLTGTLTPWLRRIAAEAGMKLLSRDERLKTHYLEHNTSNFIESDTQTMATVLKTYIESTVISPNEARKKLNLPPRPGGDEYGNPNVKSGGGSGGGAGGATVPVVETPGKRIAVPDIRQRFDFDCGAAATASVAEYFDVGLTDYAGYLAELETTPEDGTEPEEIIEFFTSRGLVVTAGEMDMDDLRKFFQAGQPVIVPLQMYGKTGVYDAEEATNQSGHYVVVTGIGMGVVLFQDPAADNAGAESAPGGLGAMSEEEFDKRWHDVGADGDVLAHYGIAVGVKAPEPVKQATVEPAAPAEPTPEPAAPPEPKPEPPAQPANAILPVSTLRPILADLLNRQAARVTKDTRGKKGAKFQELLDGKASEYRDSFDKSLRATVSVIATLKSESAEPLLTTIHGRFFAAFLDGLNPVLDKPASELAANVETACVAFETTIADRICEAVL